MFLCKLAVALYIGGIAPIAEDSTAVLGAQQSCRIKTPATPCLGQVFIAPHPESKDSRQIRWSCVKPLRTKG